MNRLKNKYSSCMECGGKMKMKKGGYSKSSKKANLANTLSKMRKGQNGMQTGEPMTYETIKSGPFKGRTFATREIPQDQRMTRLDELRIMSKEGKINRDQRQAMTDSITTYKQTKNPKISGGGAGPKYCPPGSVNVGNGNCKNKEAVHRQAEGGTRRMQGGGSVPGVNGTMIANTSNVSQPAKLAKKGTAPARRNAGTSSKSRFKSVLARKKMK